MEKLYKSSKVYDIISKDLSENMLNHSYMLISNDVEYVKLLAKNVAKHILCEKLDSCGMCNQCIKVEKNEHADVVILPNEKKNILTEDVDKIVSECYVLPLEGDRKLYVLNNFDQATVQAQNKLLKTLEEPPKSVVFVLTTTNENNVLATIKSRCKKIMVPEIDDRLLIDYLTKKNIESDKIADLIKLADGNLTKIEQFLNNENISKIKELCYDIINKFEKSSQLLTYSTRITELSQDFDLILNLLLENYRNLCADIVNKNAGNIAINKYSIEAVYEITKLIQLANTKTKSNVGITSIVDNMLLGILEVKFKCKK